MTLHILRPITGEASRLWARPLADIGHGSERILGRLSHPPISMSLLQHFLHLTKFNPSSLFAFDLDSLEVSCERLNVQSDDRRKEGLTSENKSKATFKFDVKLIAVIASNTTKPVTKSRPTLVPKSSSLMMLLG
ncbi:uncharacterized protein ARMOST_07924 [Armillaria ostoyae]|uniref:Uncharacterized protein n=1 Tax=Armillaria ostoyae TaxID=47428 RepID=A0A284R761_ARMOS|nr:uncharacterized protein ARMOST_07924 [Armillaria ostoyae]